MTQQHALQRPCAPVLVGQADKFAFDFVPVGKGVEQQTAVIVNGQYDTSLAALLDYRAITGGKRQPPFGIEIDGAATTEQIRPLRPLNFPFITTIPHFATL